MPSNVPLLLDTDIGSDIDDAVCLGYLLRQPRCELLGITTVSGRPTERAQLADALCRAAGRDDVPIFAGNDIGLLLDVVQPECQQARVLPRFAHRPASELPKGEAVDFMRRTIRSRPGEITLLAIGPMTNVGLLFALDPEIPKLLKDLVLMCGVFGHKQPWVCPAEWNARCDPLATALTYRGQASRSLSVGLDVTMRCQLPGTECIERFNAAGGPLSVVAAMCEVWADTASKVVTFHDPLAAAVIFKPALCQYAQGEIAVELASQHVRGMTHFTEREGGPHHIATSVDSQAFFDHYFGTVGGS